MEILKDPSRQPKFFYLCFGNLSFLFRYRRSASVSATEGSIFFTVKMSPEYSPALQVVAYAILPSEHVIAHKANLAVTKCFRNQVGWRTSRTGVC